MNSDTNNQIPPARNPGPLMGGGTDAPRDERALLITPAQGEMIAEALCKLVASGDTGLTVAEAGTALADALAGLNSRTLGASPDIPRSS